MIPVSTIWLTFILRLFELFVGQVTTRDGALVIVLDQAQTNDHPGLPYVSGMLQS
jgi:hypothetical protein